ncbi:hypothetical protein [Desulfosporosinus youngiae]|uniref:Uncharacterized protein n=1 Tax=Desulfosporosinus youngiae DSM 17734 TaxID=768710 RepID=H5XY85_9FIRM|nr:hypothetical protein [Desulfosporosinus youngiae]EHQ91295.1 hypothetical protein DesyoDRAFT_4340 [Desulfosporosinus youngiae DSM 17734]
MEEIYSPNDIIDLGPSDLVIVSQLESDPDVTTLNVYERERFFANPNSVNNEEQIAVYSICSRFYNQAVAEIRDLYAGWTRIDKTEPTKVIGIHNQNPKILYIQFSHGKRYFIYKRCLTINKDMVYEELFGKTHNLSRRSLNREDEQYLISKLRFMPKTKNAISFYAFKAHIRARRHFAFSH